MPTTTVQTEKERTSDERPHNVYMRSDNRNAVYDRQTHRSHCDFGDSNSGQFIDRRVSDEVLGLRILQDNTRAVASW